MLLAFDVLPGAFVGAHVLAELSSPTFGKRCSMDDLALHKDYICQLVDEEGLIEVPLSHKLDILWNITSLPAEENPLSFTSTVGLDNVGSVWAVCRSAV